MKRSTKILIIVFSFLALLGLGFFVAYIDQQLALSSGQKGEYVTLKGEVACLPHKDTEGPQTQECAIGLKAENGKYYQLADSDYYETNTQVEVTGYLIPPTDEKYQSVGTLEKAKVRKVE